MKKSEQIRRLSEYRGQKVTRASAIRLRCLECCGNQRAEVRRCPDRQCPLWPFRMGQGWEDPKDETGALPKSRFGFQDERPEE